MLSKQLFSLLGLGSGLGLRSGIDADDLYVVFSVRHLTGSVVRAPHSEYDAAVESLKCV